jgi:hypothetical protein
MFVGIFTLYPTLGERSDKTIWDFLRSIADNV